MLALFATWADNSSESVNLKQAPRYSLSGSMVIMRSRVAAPISQHSVSALNGPSISVDFICATSAPRKLPKTTNQNIETPIRLRCTDDALVQNNRF